MFLWLGFGFSLDFVLQNYLGDTFRPGNFFKRYRFVLQNYLGGDLGDTFRPGNFFKRYRFVLQNYLGADLGHTCAIFSLVSIKDSLGNRPKDRSTSMFSLAASF